MKKSELKALIKECLIEESKKEVVEESVSTKDPKEIVTFIIKNKAHFSTFLKPKVLNVEGDDGIITIEPASGSFTITVDTDKSEISGTGKPTKGMESVSYVEILTVLKHMTGFKEV